MVYNLIPIPSHGRLLVTAAAGPRTPRAFEQLELAVNPRVSRKEKKKRKKRETSISWRPSQKSSRIKKKTQALTVCKLTYHLVVFSFSSPVASLGVA